MPVSPKPGQPGLVPDGRTYRIVERHILSRRSAPAGTIGEGEPCRTPHAVTIPGAIDAWFRLLADHGTREMAELLQPAIRVAEEGFRVAPRVAADWAEQQEKLSYDPNATKHYWAGGTSPRAGDLFRQPDLAHTLPERLLQMHEFWVSKGRLGRPEEIAEYAAFLCSDRNSFMNGEIVIVDGGAVT